MNLFHRRLVSLSYFTEDLPKFQTENEIQAWYAAVGRMVLFGLAQDAPDDTVQLVQMGITQNPLELDAVYCRTLPAYQERYANGEYRSLDSHGSRIAELERYLHEESQKLGRPFVMGAVKHADGVFGFHS